MPRINVIINPADNELIEFTGTVFNGWKCPRTGKVFRHTSAYKKHLKALAKDNILRKNAEAGIIDGNRTEVVPVISKTPNKHQRQAFCRAKDFLDKAYGYGEWSNENLEILGEYILNVAILGRKDKQRD